MTDRTLREAERAADQDPQARAALIRARYRSGQLDRERVLLCAYLGDEQCRLLIPNCLCWSGREATRAYHVWTTCQTMGHLDLWAKGLERWGLEVCMLAGLAAGWAVLRTEERAQSVIWSPDDDSYRYTDTDAMQLAPSINTLLVPPRAALTLAERRMELAREQPDHPVIRHLDDTMQTTSHLTTLESWAAVGPFLLYPWADASTGEALRHCLISAARQIGWRRVREAIRERVVPWVVT